MMWPDSQRTSKLLDAAREGDESAINELLEGHRPPLRRAVELRMDPALMRRVDASDIVQEVMVEVNRRLADYLNHPVLPFDLWLRQLARDRLIDAHRRHRVAQRRSLDREQPLAAAADSGESGPEVPLCDPELTPAAAATWQELNRRFESAMARIDEHDREVVRLRHFEQFSNQDVARALNLSEAAASMRYLRAIRRLRALLAEAAVPD